MNSPELVWKDPEPVIVSPELALHVGGHPVIAETLARRGITSPAQAEAFLNPAKYIPADPHDLPDLTQAVERIKLALTRGEKLGVWGDFDVDGQTSTTLLVDALRQLGGDVIYHIPVRAVESHGITLPALRTFLDQGVQLLITCDTGITAHEAIAYAASRHVPTIITDHHQLSAELPAGLAVINPQRLPVHHPLHPLCGVGCAFQLVLALYAELTPDPTAHTTQFLDLVALGTVADVAELRQDNRWLVQRGLAQLRTHPRPGIDAILQLAEVSLSNFTEEQIAFQLAPRLNAIGRLDDANPLVDFFLSEDEQFIRVMATRLEGLNSERRFQTRQILAAAQSMITQDPHLLTYEVLVLAHPAWVRGIVGIVASRLAEVYQRPVILLTTPPGQPAGGSARSIEGIHITQAIAACQELLFNYGGHPMAAGLSLDPEHIPDFRRQVSQAVRAQTRGRPLVYSLQLDATLELEDITLALAQDIERLAPFGAGNPALNFLVQNLTLKSSSEIGKNKEHRQMIVENHRGYTQKVLWWQSTDLPLPESPFDLVFNLRSSTFQGQNDVQMTWVAHQHRPSLVPVAEPSWCPEIIDLRHHPDPHQALIEIQARETDLMIWGENAAVESVAMRNRLELSPATSLVIWSTPPGPSQLHQACQKVAPQRIYVFDQPPSANFLPPVLESLQNALDHQEGWVSVSSLAAAAAQTETTIRTLLELFTAQGQLILVASRADQLQFQRGGTPAPGDSIARQRTALQSLTEETQAYRRYYAHAPLDTLIRFAD